MDSGVLILMLSVSLFLGAIALFAFLWAIKNNQFNDEKKWMSAVLFDGEEELNDAADAQKKRDEATKRKKEEYRPE